MDPVDQIREIIHEGGPDTLSKIADVLGAAPAEQQREQALDLLEILFDAYENGVPCYEEPDEEADFVGYAFKLEESTFQACCTLLNKERPRDAAPTPPAEQPIDLVLHCPACGMQHVDAPEGQFYPGQTAEESVLTNKAYGLWTNPPHRSHLCHACGYIWRPADVPTNGVAAVKTKGKNDSSPAEQQREQAPVAWMFPDDLKEFEVGEHTATAYSIKMGSPDGTTVPLYTHPSPSFATLNTCMSIEQAPPAEHKVAQEPAAWMTPGGDVTRSKVFADEQSALSFGRQRPTPLYTQPSPSLAELRAKVEALPVVDTTEVPDWHAVYLHAVLAEIDKMGGKV